MSEFSEEDPLAKVEAVEARIDRQLIAQEHRLVPILGNFVRYVIWPLHQRLWRKLGGKASNEKTETLASGKWWPSFQAFLFLVLSPQTAGIGIISFATIYLGFKANNLIDEQNALLTRQTELANLEGHAAAGERADRILSQGIRRASLIFWLDEELQAIRTSVAGSRAHIFTNYPLFFRHFIGDEENADTKPESCNTALLGSSMVAVLSEHADNIALLSELGIFYDYHNMEEAPFRDSNDFRKFARQTSGVCDLDIHNTLVAETENRTQVSVESASLELVGAIEEFFESGCRKNSSPLPSQSSQAPVPAAYRKWVKAMRRLPTVKVCTAADCHNAVEARKEIDALYDNRLSFIQPTASACARTQALRRIELEELDSMLQNEAVRRADSGILAPQGKPVVGFLATEETKSGAMLINGECGQEYFVDVGLGRFTCNTRINPISGACESRVALDLLSSQEDVPATHCEGPVGWSDTQASCNIGTMTATCGYEPR